MESAGSALMGIGTATGEGRATKAAQEAINSPLLDINIAGATGVLFAISGGDDLTMLEIQEAANVITKSVDANARIIFGTIEDSSLKKGDIKVTVIATGFPRDKSGTFVDDNYNDEKVQEEKSGKFSLFGGKTQEQEEDNQNDEPHEIHNELPKEDEIEESEKPKKQKTGKTESDDEDFDEDGDDWGGIPSFLKRSLK